MVIMMSALSPAAHAETLSLSSPDFKDGDTLNIKFANQKCGGENVAPKLQWSKAPEGTKYIAVTVYDPDAPTGSGWWHWLVVNLPADTTELNANNLPSSALETRTDYNVGGYGGPCPPVGDKPHRYIFTVYALKDKIQTETAEIPPAQIGFQINFTKIAESSITGYFGR